MAEINDIIENEDNENLGIDDVEELVNPEVPDTIDNQQLTVYVPLATGDTPGIAKFDKDHFVVKDGNVKLLNPSAGGSTGGSSTTTIDLPLSKGTGKDSIQQTSSTATEEKAVALGFGTQATKTGAFTSGIGTVANGKGQAVVGSYNSPKHDAMFIVGNGENSKSKSNAFEVFFDGRVNFDKSEFAKVSTGEITRILTGEGSSQVSKIVLAVGFVPNIVFIRCKDVAKGFTTTWINGYDSEGNSIPIIDNTITFTIPTDKGTEFTYVAMAVDSNQGTPPEVPPSGDEPEIPEEPDVPDSPDEPEEPDTPETPDDSTTITFILDGKEYNCPKGKTWRYLTDNRIIPELYNWQNSSNITEEELKDSGEPYTDADLMLWTVGGGDYIIYLDDNGNEVVIHPDSKVVNGTEYGQAGSLLYPPVDFHFIDNNTGDVTSRTVDFYSEFSGVLAFVFDKEIEDNAGYLYIADVGYFYYFKPDGAIEYLDFITAITYYAGDFPTYMRTLYYSLEKNIGLFTFNGRHYTYDLNSPIRWKAWLAEKFPEYEIVVESPLYIKDKGVIYYSFYGDGSYDDDGNYREPGQEYQAAVSATDFIGEYTYWFNNDYTVFSVEIDGATKTYAYPDEYMWVDWAVMEGYDIHSDGQPFEIDIGWMDVYGGGLIEPGHYIVMPKEDYTVYLNDTPITVPYMNTWEYLCELGMLGEGEIKDGYFETPPYDINNFYLCKDDIPVLVSKYPIPNEHYYFKILFKVNDKQYAISKETTWVEYVAEDSSEFKIVNGLVYHKTTNKLLYYRDIPVRGWEPISGSYYFNDPKIITFYVDSTSYNVIKGLTWYDWITDGEGKNYFEEHENYIRHKETHKYVVNSTGSRIPFEPYADDAYIIANEYYVYESQTIPVIGFTIVHTVNNVQNTISDYVATGTKWNTWVESNTDKRYCLVGQYVSVDNGKTLVAYADGTRVTENSAIEETTKPYTCVPAVKFKIIPLYFDPDIEDVYDDEENILEDDVLGGTTWGQWADDNGYMPLYEDEYVSIDGGQSYVINSSKDTLILDETTYRCGVILAPWE